MQIVFQCATFDYRFPFRHLAMTFVRAHLSNDDAERSPSAKAAASLLAAVAHTTRGSNPFPLSAKLLSFSDRPVPEQNAIHS